MSPGARVAPGTRMNNKTEHPTKQPESKPAESEVITQISEEELENVTGAGSFPALMQTEYQQNQIEL